MHVRVCVLYERGTHCLSVELRGKSLLSLITRMSNPAGLIPALHLPPGSGAGEADRHDNSMPAPQTATFSTVAQVDSVTFNEM